MNLSFPRPETMNPPDQYDEDERAILQDEYDAETFRTRVYRHWNNGSPLFKFLGPKYRNNNKTYCGKSCGCPTMVKGGQNYSAWTAEMDMAVKYMPIPDSDLEITPEQLTYFKVIQRLADALYKRNEQPADETD